MTHTQWILRNMEHIIVCQLVVYIHKKINERYILRYAKYIEMIAKNKI